MLCFDGVQALSSVAVPWNAPRAFSDLLGDLQVSPKRAVRTARLIEDQFLKDGWPLGRAYGRSFELAQHYQIGQAVTRETVRILEARGTGRMRTGRSAGLEVAAPSIEQLSSSLGSHCYLAGISRAQVDAASLILKRVAARLAARRTQRGEMSAAAPILGVANEQDLIRGLMDASGNRVIAFFMRCMDQARVLDLSEVEGGASTARSGDWRVHAVQLSDAVARGDVAAALAGVNACSNEGSDSPRMRDSQVATAERSAPLGAKLALQIADNLLRSLAPGQWQDGRFLGNEEDLCERYDVSRRSMRQAIRILEAGEAAVTLPGRGRGLMASSVKPATLSRLICYYFACENFAHHDAFETFEWLSVETVAYAAQNASSSRMAKFAEEVAPLLQSKAPLSTPLQIRLETQQFALVNNPILEIFLRSAHAYPTWDPRGRPPQRRGAVSEFAECNNELIKALIERDAAAAANAQSRKFAIMNSCLD